MKRWGMAEKELGSESKSVRIGATGGDQRGNLDPDLSSPNCPGGRGCLLQLIRPDSVFKDFPRRFDL